MRKVIKIFRNFLQNTSIFARKPKEKKIRSIFFKIF